MEHFQSELRRSFPEAMVAGYEELIPVMTNDEKDRHGVAVLLRLGRNLPKFAGLLLDDLELG